MAIDGIARGIVCGKIEVLQPGDFGEGFRGGFGQGQQRHHLPGGHQPLQILLQAQQQGGVAAEETSQRIILCGDIREQQPCLQAVGNRCGP